jgi:tetratricopeptide (TPR) repeat protein
VLGPEHPDTAKNLENLAILLSAEGAFAGAWPLWERALAIYEKALGPEHPETARSLNNLAVLLRDQGDFAGAWPLSVRALVIYEKAFGPDHAGTKNSARVTADALDALGRTEEAKALREGYGLT